MRKAAFGLILSFLVPNVAWAGLGKDAIPTTTLVAAGVMASNITAAPLDVRLVDNIAFQYTTTSTAVGAIFVDCTIDNPNTVSSPTWVALSLSPAPTVSGAGNGIIELNQTGCGALRFRYTATSGSGTLVLKARAKQIGGAGS